MTARQIRFCDEYLISGNATDAAKKAGYSEKTAYSMGQQLLKKLEVQNYLEAHMAQLHSQKIASAEEVMEYLTSVVRGESKAEVIVNQSMGDGYSEIRHVKKGPDEKDRLKAAELLAKRYGILSDRINVDVVAPVIISGDKDLED